jgi:hypothetical protein
MKGGDMEYKRDMRNECYHCKHMREVPGNAHIKCAYPDSKMRGDSHGIKNGWFFYPFLFDPVWKTESCNNYENHEAVSNAISQAVSQEINESGLNIRK